ncbi:hypothetical protein CSA80_03470 [Candidatus Saccharibacteria bacterium]|nr:MAG: hypothetical protein CR973_00965 [Candidatus Saccharibacteria bacterium]PID99147.1 MAG: hypothetical protein CSA80_03470 [Candidatus Saccharibacteria bacterium]
MYQVDRRTHRHHRARRRALKIAAVLLFAGAVFGLSRLQIAPQQEIRNAPSLSKAYASRRAEKIAVEKPLFRMKLLAGWKEVSAPSGPTAPAYRFQSPTDDAQTIEFFIDKIPTNLSFNKALALSTDGSALQYDAVSENCVKYTDASRKGPNDSAIPAKWQGIDFLCDAANTSRAVVGTVSKDGPNFLQVATPTQGTHKLFIVYVDNSIGPDYSTLYEILSSVRFK